MISDDFFLIGVVIGAVAVALTGLIWFLLRWLLRARSAFYQPQKITHFTEKTPADIGQKAGFAGLGLFGFKLIVILFIWGWLDFSNPQVADLIYHMIFQILIVILETLINIFQIIVQQLKHY